MCRFCHFSHSADLEARLQGEHDLHRFWVIPHGITTPAKLLGGNTKILTFLVATELTAEIGVNFSQSKSVGGCGL